MPQPMPQLGDIPGGIWPAGNKVQSLTQPIVQASIPSTLRIAVSQFNSEDSEVLVKEGDRVLKGQLIARGKLNTGVHHHASSSGMIKNISVGAIPNQSNIPDECITIMTDGEDKWIPHKGTNDFLTLTYEQLLTQITEAGISGLGGAGFPTHTKISGNADNIHTLIINACECEPFITADDALMREQAEDILIGIKILLHMLKPKRCVIGIEDNKPEAYSALQRANEDQRIELVQIPSKYPSGAEKQLIQILTNTEIPSGMLAISEGILCQNVATVFAIKRAICDGEPLISRITTVTGAALNKPCNMQVLIGTPISDLLESCGLDHNKFSNLIMGGSLMGISLTRTDLPILKTSACLIASTAEELPPPPPAQACIRCGLCAEVCPVSLLPQQLYWFARSEDKQKAEQHHMMDCIECGACAYVCPSHIPLVQYYRASKASIKQERNLHLRAHHSQKRFENREVRLEADKAQANLRRQERAELAKKNREAKEADLGKANDAKIDPIQAALARVKAKQAENAKAIKEKDNDILN